MRTEDHCYLLAIASGSRSPAQQSTTQLGRVSPINTVLSFFSSVPPSALHFNSPIIRYPIQLVSATRHVTSHGSYRYSIGSAELALCMGADHVVTGSVEEGERRKSRDWNRRGDLLEKEIARERTRPESSDGVSQILFFFFWCVCGGAHCLWIIAVRSTLFLVYCSTSAYDIGRWIQFQHLFVFFAQVMWWLVGSPM